MQHRRTVGRNELGDGDMTARQGQLSFGFEEDPARVAGWLDRRSHRREATVRHVEFTPFPRAAADVCGQRGFTRDVSPSGMALVTEHALPVGSLVRVIVLRADGQPDFDAVARVAWCEDEEAAGSGAAQARVGLSLLAEVKSGMARVRNVGSPPVRAAC